jgi:photosystem II stability/assembly factor-like uncharacterized protein
MKNIIISSLVGLLWLGAATSEAQQWRFLGLADREVLSLETDPVEPRAIVAGTDYEGLFVTFDWGQSWEYRIATNVPVPFVSYDLFEEDSLYALVGDSYSAGLHKSDDGGDTWGVVNYLSYPRRMGFDAVNPGYYYVCFPDGIQVSQDFGRNFVDASSGLPAPDVLDVTGDGVNGLEAYAAGEAFVARTTDFGSSWSDLGGLFGLEDYNPARIEFEPNGPDTLYVSCWAYFARSFDRGQNWDYTATPTTYNVPIACDPEVAGLLYLGSKGGGVLMSTDAGASFTAMNDGLDNLDVNCLAFDPLGRLLAGTADGVYIYGVEDIPTLSQWGMIVLALLVLVIGTVAIIRMRKLAEAR